MSFGLGVPLWLAMIFWVLVFVCWSIRSQIQEHSRRLALLENDFGDSALQSGDNNFGRTYQKFKTHVRQRLQRTEVYMRVAVFLAIFHTIAAALMYWSLQ